MRRPGQHCRFRSGHSRFAPPAEETLRSQPAARTRPSSGSPQGTTIRPSRTRSAPVRGTRNDRAQPKYDLSAGVVAPWRQETAA